MGPVTRFIMSSHDHTQVSKRIIPSLILYFLALKTNSIYSKKWHRNSRKKENFKRFPFNPTLPALKQLKDS